MDATSNWLLEGTDKYVKAPDISEISVKNPDDYITLLNNFSSPRERLRHLFISTFNISETPSHEAMWIRKLLIVSFGGGFFFGALLNSPDIHQDYIRQHNASVFENKYIGNRHFWDTLATRCAGRGMRYGIRSCLFTAGIASIGVGSVTYRNELYLPDWLIGFSTLGGISRLWIGPRGVAAGAIIGFFSGLFAYGCCRAAEKLAGISVSEMEYLSHKQWLETRKVHLNYLHLGKEDIIMEATRNTIETNYPR